MMNLEALLDLILVDIKSFVERKRNDVKALALSILLYQQGLSLRRTSKLLSYKSEPINYGGTLLSRGSWCV
ncbi:hypothetical protein [Methanohalobium evestigatum]|uniref:hypothetical protein n=1 Tax=Methanohalobium evestigatum TaxID=2322 RepID=UPI0012F65897|nr:hypothetical protein [Methanohalobium evestigatum]